MTDDRFGPPPIEPLSDVEWLRVERGVWAELDAADAPVPLRRSRRAIWVSGAALAAAAAAVTLFVALGDHGTTPAPTGPVAHEAAPARVVTDAGASEVSFGDARITVAPHSAVLLNGAADSGVLVVVERGAAQFAVAPREHRPRFVVQAGDVSVRVVGTEFGVARYGDSARVEVIKGTVEVVAPGERTLVHAGETWPTETAAAEPAPATGGSDATDDSAADTADTTPAPTPAPRRHHHRATHPEAGTAPTTNEPPTKTAPEGVPPPTAQANDAAAHAFAAAAALEATDPAGALAGYARLAAGSGPWAANALYAAARLHYDRGNFTAAQRLLSRYLARFPRGANAEDARALLNRLQGAQ